MSPLLVDSSVWIQSFSKKPNHSHLTIIKSAAEAKNIATCEVIVLEVVRGAKNETEYDELWDQFHAMFILSVTSEHWALATKMGYQLSRKGFQPPSTDLLIASVAIIKNCTLLHQDKDFTNVARYFPLKCL